MRWSRKNSLSAFADSDFGEDAGIVAQVYGKVFFKATDDLFKIGSPWLKTCGLEDADQFYKGFLEVCLG